MEFPSPFGSKVNKKLLHKNPHPFPRSQFFRKKAAQQVHVYLLPIKAVGHLK
jgi:hypothetical protein